MVLLVMSALLERVLLGMNVVIYECTGAVATGRGGYS